jgi:hypothetical protein
LRGELEPVVDGGDGPAGLRWRFWVELLLAGTGWGVAVVTIAMPDWFERLGVSIDNRNGLAEWVSAAVLVVVSLASSLAVRAEWLRAWASAAAVARASSRRLSN